jgi:hypothetical protein
MNQVGNDVCNTNPQTPGCLQSLLQDHYEKCRALRAQLQEAMLELDRLQQGMKAACTPDSQATECILLTRRHAEVESELESLRQRLKFCPA